MRKPDFCGWATKSDLKCADGLVIQRGAFSSSEGKRVPLVWNHQHNDPSKVLGHAVLSNKDEGVWAECYFNDNPKAQDAKRALEHGDISSLSIWANNLYKEGNNVRHGVIREVSMVLAGANPGAFVESVASHGLPMDEEDDEGIFYTGEEIYLAHADDEEYDEEEEDDEEMGSERTVAEVIDDMTDEQKAAVAILVGQALEEGEPEDDEEEEDDEEMKHNIFEGDYDDGGEYLAHSIDFEQLMDDAKRLGSFRDALREYDDGELYHALNTTGMELATGTQTYGFNDPSMLFPDFKSLNTPPEWISRNMDWVSKVMAQVRHTPFSRIKSVYADITEDEARARGYIKGKEKKEEVFTTLKRTTTPQTVYKLQKMDRDDVIDITEFDVIAWIRAEMRVMLNEEIARAILIGDGRPADSDDKIQEAHIRPIVKDVPLFNIMVKVSGANDANNIIETILRARKNYKGSGNPTFWTTEDVLTEMLLLKDGIGHRLYKTEAELATALRVSSIVTVEPMEGQKVSVDGTDKPLIGVIVNLNDYNVGADKGGEIKNYDDFDIKFNQQLYLIETRISGALVKPFSAMTIVDDGTASGASYSTRNQKASE